MIKNIIFDLGRVLVTFDWDILVRKIGFTEEEVEIFRQKVMKDRWNEFDRGVMEDDEVVSYIKEAIPGMEDKFDEFLRRVSEAIEAYPYSEDWVKDTKAKGYRVYILSNYPKNLFLKGCENKLKFTELADGKVVSAFVKMIKPDPAIYEHLLNKYGLKAEECIFIDDLEANVRAAESLGIHGIQFKGQEDAIREIERITREESNR